MATNLRPFLRDDLGHTLIADDLGEDSERAATTVVAQRCWGSSKSLRASTLSAETEGAREW